MRKAPDDVRIYLKQHLSHILESDFFLAPSHPNSRGVGFILFHQSFSNEKSLGTRVSLNFLIVPHQMIADII